MKIFMIVRGDNIMPRKARVQSPTDYYHVMIRGNNRDKIFADKNQKAYFLDCLKEQYDEGLIDIAAYCIMDNHVHLVIKAELENLSKAIKKINIKYAIRYNNHYDRIGHVFQDRFKSEIIDNQTYLLNVIRYVHNNPVKAKIVSEFNDYKWSSYREYIKANRIISDNQKNFILECYNNIYQFIKFHKEVDDNEYLDIKEDIEKYRMEKAQKIILIYLNKYELTGIDELKGNRIFLIEVINDLLYKTKLSHRQIAKLLNVSNSVVHKVNLEAKRTVPNA